MPATVSRPAQEQIPVLHEADVIVLGGGPGGIGAAVGAARNGAKTVLLERYGFLGGMATAIYSEPPRPNDADNPVRFVTSAGMPAGIWEAFEKRFDVRVLEFYGAMDGGGVAYKPVGHGPTGSFGKPIPSVEMKILDDAGRECPPGVVGEICTRPAGASAAPP